MARNPEQVLKDALLARPKEGEWELDGAASGLLIWMSLCQQISDLEAEVEKLESEKHLKPPRL